METVKDTNGHEWQVGTVLMGYEARRAQIAPGYGQINISPVGKGGNHRGLQLPETVIQQWLDGTINVKVRD